MACDSTYQQKTQHTCASSSSTPHRGANRCVCDCLLVRQHQAEHHTNQTNDRANHDATITPLKPAAVADDAQ